MSGLKFTNDPSPSMPDKPLSDPSVGVDLVGGTVEYSGQHKLSGVQLGLSIQGNASVAAFNSPDDKDKDGVLGVPVKDDDVFKITLPPQVELTTSDAWLKYRAEAMLKVSASGEVSPVAFKLDASKKAVITDYHLHSRNENTRAAAISDVSNLRFVADPADVLKIGNKEALSYQVRGELSASVTLSWSDAFTASLSSLSQFLQSGKMIALKISPAASVTFKVGLVDDFKVIFTKAAGDKIRVAVKKTDSREIGVSAQAGVTVEFEDKKVVKDALTQLVESLIGEQMNAIDNIFKKTSFDNLTPAEKRIKDALIERLGLKDAVQSLQELKEKWEAIKKRIEDTIDQIAKAKVALAFAYEYLRVRTEDSLLIVDLEPDNVKKFHNDLMLCSLVKLLDWVKNDKPNALVKYLNQTTLKRSHAWGFSLGVGPWNVGGKDKYELTSVVQRNIQDDERIAYRGLRGYDGTWVSDKANWNVDFKAEMKDFAKKGEATACQFKYGLHLKWLWEEKKLKKSELEVFLDYAVIWRIITQDNVTEILETLKGDLNKKAQVSLELTFDDDAFRSILPMAASAVDGELPSQALAKAMPYWEMYEARQTPLNRLVCYGPLWKYYFENDSEPIDSYSMKAAGTVLKMTHDYQIPNGAGLANFEKNGVSSSSNAYQDHRTFSGQIFHHGYSNNNASGLHRNWLSFARGLKELNTALKPGNCAPHKKIEEVFKLMTKFWTQTLYVRAVGVFLMDLASTDSTLYRKINRALTITPKDGDVIAINSAV